LALEKSSLPTNAGELLGAVRRGERLVGRRFEGGSASGADLHGADLAGVELVEVDLRFCDLQSANLTGALLHTCDLERADLTDCRLAHATLVDNRWEGVTADGAQLDGAILFPDGVAALLGAAGAPRVTTEREASRRAVLRLGAGLRQLALGGALDAARSDIAEAARLAPGWALPLIELAEVEKRLGKTAAVAAVYERAVRLLPGDSLLVRKLARSLVESGQAARALELLLQLNREAPGNILLLRELAWAATCAGRTTAARAALTEAELLLGLRRQAPPGSAEARAQSVELHLQFAAVEAITHRTQAALQRFRAAIVLAPERADLLRPFGEFCEEHLDAPEVAEEAYAGYLGESARDRLIWLRRTRLLVRLGDAAGAVDTFARGNALAGPGTQAAPLDSEEVGLITTFEPQLPFLLDRAYRFEALAQKVRPLAEQGDLRAGLLLSRALVALSDPALPEWLTRLLAHPALDPPAETELVLRKKMHDGIAQSEPAAMDETDASIAPEPLLKDPALFTAAAQRVAAGPDADCLLELPRPQKTLFAAAAAAAWRRTQAEHEKVRELLSNAGPHLPSVLSCLLYALDRDDDRENVERYSALPPEPRILYALAEQAKKSSLSLTELDAIAVLWILGYGCKQAAQVPQPLPRAAMVQALMHRLDIVARGLLSLSLRPYL
jgi:Tfp pilus assembly protein PilF